MTYANSPSLDMLAGVAFDLEPGTVVDTEQAPAFSSSSVERAAEVSPPILRQAPLEQYHTSSDSHLEFDLVAPEQDSMPVRTVQAHPTASSVSTTLHSLSSHNSVSNPNVLFPFA